ncbi:MAG: leucine-rich repeat domain-containing protein [Ruminococcaceae bacterium]|nr:leucine-rich repeat domain-containing protein [Oscillospiraceae bacterium]
MKKERLYVCIALLLAVCCAFSACTVPGETDASMDEGRESTKTEEGTADESEEDVVVEKETTSPEEGSGEPTVEKIELSYRLSDDKSYYIVDGPGNYMEDELIIPSVYAGLPVKEVEAYAFSFCPYFTGITIPSSIERIGELAFSIGSPLERISVEEGNDVYKAVGNCLIEIKSKTLLFGCNGSVIPTDGSVTKIGADAFFGCTELTELVLPETVTDIGSCAFLGCDSLESVVFPSTLVSIGEEAFQGCNRLTSLTLPASLASIGVDAFMGCTGLERITVENNAVYMAVGNCLIETESKTLVFGCKTSLIPDDGSVLHIGDGAFENCEDLTCITLPKDLRSIGTEAFWGCMELNDVVLPAHLESIGESAFFDCVSLEALSLPASVKTVGTDAFYGCSSLSSIAVAEENPVYMARKTV